MFFKVNKPHAFTAINSSYLHFDCRTLYKLHIITFSTAMLLLFETFENLSHLEFSNRLIFPSKKGTGNCLLQLYPVRTLLIRSRFLFSDHLLATLPGGPQDATWYYLSWSLKWFLRICLCLVFGGGKNPNFSQIYPVYRQDFQLWLYQYFETEYSFFSCKGCLMHCRICSNYYGYWVIGHSSSRHNLKTKFVSPHCWKFTGIQNYPHMRTTAIEMPNYIKCPTRLRWMTMLKYNLLDEFCPYPHQNVRSKEWSRH